jgi:hypothetical protein
MDDILTWIYIIAIVLAGGFIIYIFGSIPMMINQKKQVVAYRKLASLYGFEIKNDKVKFFPHWPTIKGFYNKKYFIVTQAKYGKSTSFYNSATGTWRTSSNYITKISTKLWEPAVGNFKIVNSNIFKNEFTLSEFDTCFSFSGESADKVKSLLNEKIKQEMINLLNEGGICILKSKTVFYLPQIFMDWLMIKM